MERRRLVLDEHGLHRGQLQGAQGSREQVPRALPAHVKAYHGTRGRTYILKMKKVVCTMVRNGCTGTAVPEGARSSTGQ